MVVPVLDDQQELTCNIFVQTVCSLEDLLGAIADSDGEKERERETRKFMQAVELDNYVKSASVCNYWENWTF